MAAGYLMKNKEGKTLYYDPKTKQARNFNIPKGAKFKTAAKPAAKKSAGGGGATKPKARPGKPGESTAARTEATRTKTVKRNESAMARTEANRPKAVKRSESAMARTEATRTVRGKEQRYRPAGAKPEASRPKGRPGAARENLLQLAIKNFGEVVGRKKHAAVSRRAQPPKTKLRPRTGSNFPAG